MNKPKKSLKILIVDDEFLIQKALSLASQSRGHEVQVASHGVEGLKLWETFDPDLVFLDVLMPEMDGFTLLKKRPEQSQAKVIMISAHDEIQDQEIKKKEVDLFVKKPFEDIYLLIERGENLVIGY